jgi:hypothetical protein
MTRFLFFLFLPGSCFLFILGRPLWREGGYLICSAICQWSDSQRIHNHTLLSHPSATTGLPFRRLLRTSEVEVTLQLTVGQSVSISRYQAHSTFCPKVVFWKLLSCLYGVPSLTRGRVCHLSFSNCSNLSVCTSSIYVACVLQFSNLYKIYTSFFQSRNGTADYMMWVFFRLRNVTCVDGRKPISSDLTRATGC